MAIRIVLVPLNEISGHGRWMAPVVDNSRAFKAYSHVLHVSRSPIETITFVGKGMGGAMVTN